MSQKLDNCEKLDKSFRLLAGRLDLAEEAQLRLVVCGGSALMATGLRVRATSDADVLALMNSEGLLIDPEPLPPFLLAAATQVARDLGLSENWLNNQPSQGEGGLFQMGLPSGLRDRLTQRIYGPRLSVFFIGRLDQIHLKLYAVADQRDPVHLDDLLALNPTSEELVEAARWAMTHDVSEPFRDDLKRLLRQLGYGTASENI